MRFPWPVVGVTLGGGLLAWLLWPRSTTASEEVPRAAPHPSPEPAPVPVPLNTGWTDVTWPEGGHTVTITVADDYLPPSSVLDAQAILDGLGAMFPTRKMVDKIYAAAPLKLPFHAMNPDVEGVSRGSEEMIRRHQLLTEQDRAGRTGLASGHQKDYVLSRIATAGKCVIYGGRYASGALVQPLSNIHSISYADYSQAGRPVKRTMLLDGQAFSLENVLRDPTLAGLVSDEGTIGRVRYG